MRWVIIEKFVVHCDKAEEVIETYENGYFICGHFDNNLSWLIKTDMIGNNNFQK
jgi:hypothetical protein